MSNYVRQSSFSNGDIIEAPFFNAEFDQLVEAFKKETGHKHDGSDGEGGYISLIANEDNSTGVRIDTADPNRWCRFYDTIRSKWFSSRYC